jgi:hypothetical protein
MSVPGENREQPDLAYLGSGLDICPKEVVSIGVVDDADLRVHKNLISTVTG